MAAKKTSGNGFRNERKLVNRTIKKGLDTLLQNFLCDDTAQEYVFSSSLTSDERAYVHTSAHALGLVSRSHGKNEKRQLKLLKTEKFKKIMSPPAKLLVLPQTLDAAAQLLHNFPLTDVELNDVTPLMKQQVNSIDCGRHVSDCIKLREPVIPPPILSSVFLEDRKQLPTWTHKKEILEKISQNQVVLISGDTGSGKTTQIPQYILELFSKKKEPVRIICTQPRRIAAISVAERVAAERGESLGSTVGYQIRLESRISSKTALVFCTTGILLRTLMYQENSLQQVTHLLIDEVHERDRFVDFLLGVLRLRLSRFPQLRLIIMSAALDTEIFSNYFSNCPVLKVEGKCFPVAEYFLEDVLDFTNHLNNPTQMQIGVWDEFEENGKAKSTKPEQKNAKVRQFNSAKVPNELDPGEKLRFDKLIQQVFIEDESKAAQLLSHAITTNTLPVNYRHSQTSMTPLMAVAARGKLDLVNLFLKFGADPSYETGEWTAAKLARSMQHYAVADALAKNQDNKLQSLLRIYKDRYDDEVINLDLVMDLLHYIERQKMNGAILIFLPGYEEIMGLRDRILHSDRRFSNSAKHEVYILHSSMQSHDQRRVFLRPPKGKRKIVLSTNLAETSITIDDIVYVIDTGKVKVKSYDALTGVTALKAEWIPQASAIQRRGRAGRCQEGICFHLFSREKFENFERFQVPEIIRVPIEELCLQSKNLAPADLSISQFIALVPEAPTPLVIQRAVKLLQWMDALDPWENVTDLGRLLLELPVEPRLGKMLLTATVLHCLDPVLTIVCCLSYRDPFLLPGDSQEKKAAAQRKSELAGGTMSDHMALLRAFNLWQASRANGKQRDFCYRYYLSHTTMEVIHQLRSQILDQLRKSGFVRSLEALNQNASSWVAVKACILSGLYPQVARACRSGKLLARYETAVRLHKTSTLIPDDNKASQRKALANLPSEWLIYEEISTHGGLIASLRCVTLISPLVLAVFGGHCRLPLDAIKESSSFVTSLSSSDDDCFDDEDFNDELDEDELDDDDEWTDVTTSSEDTDEKDLRDLCQDFENLANQFTRNNLMKEKSPKLKSKRTKQERPMVELCLDDWISLKMEKNAAQEILQLRKKWQALFARRMRNPLAIEESDEREIINTLLNILAKEEEANRFPASPEFLGVAELHHKQRTDGSWRNPNIFHKKKSELRRNCSGSDRNGQAPIDTISSDSNQPSTKSLILNPYHKGNKQRDLGSLRYKTGIPEVDFKDALALTWDRERSMEDIDFKNHLSYNNSIQLSQEQYKQTFYRTSENKNRSASNRKQQSSSISNPLTQHPSNQNGRCKNNGFQSQTFSEPRSIKPFTSFKSNSAESSNRSLATSPMLQKPPFSGKYADPPIAHGSADTSGKKKRFRLRGRTSPKEHT